MIEIGFYKNRTVGVLGLGRTGIATAAALIAGGAKVFGWDDNNSIAKKALQAIPKLKLLPPEASEWRGVSLLSPSPGINEKHNLIKDLALLKIPIIGDVELFGMAMKASPAPGKTIAITGTNGKSTLTALTAHILRDAGFRVLVGGNIGVPVLELSPIADDIIYVLEVSSYQALHIKKFSPTIAVQLNLTPDHTERHGSLRAYAEAKAKLFANLGKGDLAIVNVEDEFGKKLGKSVKGKTNLVELHKIKLMPKLDIGEHNEENIKAAFRIAKHFKVGDEMFANSLASFQTLPHRREVIAKIKNILFVNDSKATNAEAAKQALSIYKDIHWLAGGAAKAEGFVNLKGQLKNVKHAYLFGQAAPLLEEFLLPTKTPYSKYKNLKEATSAAMKNAKSGVVMLSPSCASFDEYRDFEQRGLAFGSYVRRNCATNFIIAAGGTGGGVFPAQGLAHQLRKKGKPVFLFHDERSLPYIEKNSWDKTYRIFSAPAAARGFFGLISASFWLGLGLLQSIFLLLKMPGHKIIIGFGGYPSVPVVLAGALLRVPIILHEPGGVIGKANKTLLRFAKKLSLSLPLKADKSILIGNPVRPQIARLSLAPYLLPRKIKPATPFRILIFAGSQGAEWFDENITEAMRLVSQKYALAIVQQCRSKQASIKNIYESAAIPSKLAPFFEDIPQEIANAHLVIARAGASTISEILLLSRPAILIPHIGEAPGAEQKANAENFIKAGAGWLVSERDFSPSKLAQKIEKLIADKGVLAKASIAANKKTGNDGSLNAAEKLAELVIKISAEANV